MRFPSLLTNREKVQGELQRLTQATGTASSPAVSSDGKRMVYITTRSGTAQVHFKDLRSAKDMAITTAGPDKSAPTISPDGTAVAYVDAVKPNVGGIFA